MSRLSGIHAEVYLQAETKDDWNLKTLEFKKSKKTAKLKVPFNL